MANLLWGQVYYQDQFAGYLRQETGGRVSFVYDEAYVNADQPAISCTLPLQLEPYVHPQGLPPFFDNLVAEGWLEQAQKKLLGKRIISRFELLLAYGYDCAGAVSVLDPEPELLSGALIDQSDPKEVAVLTNRASLSGVQPKLAVVERDGKFFPVKFKELSTHIAKFPSSGHVNLVINEYLSMQAFKALLPGDGVADVHVGKVEGVPGDALIIKRFDRNDGGRLHFEEFNQLLGYPSSMKYEGAYKDMSRYILDSRNCLATENYRLYLRILAGLLIGNTDMHFKNFAMMHTPEGLRLSPSYDQVAAALYDYKTVALALGGASNLPIGKLKARSVIALGREFALSEGSIKMAVKQLESNLDVAIQVVFNAEIGSQKLKQNLIELMRKKWNGIFGLVGKTLSKRP